MWVLLLRVTIMLMIMSLDEIMKTYWDQSIEKISHLIIFEASFLEWDFDNQESYCHILTQVGADYFQQLIMYHAAGYSLYDVY